MPSVSSMATQAKSSAAALAERVLVAAGLLGGERDCLRGSGRRSPRSASGSDQAGRGQMEVGCGLRWPRASG